MTVGELWNAARMESFVDVGDVTLYVHELGQRTGKPSLVVMHGGPDVGHGYLLPGFEPLARDHHIVLFDFRGCGRSTRGLPDDELQPEYVVQDTHRLIDKLGLGQVDLLGFSTGGRAAMHFVDKHPQQVRRLVLASTTAYSSTESAQYLAGWQEYERRERRPPQLHDLRLEPGPRARLSRTPPSHRPRPGRLVRGTRDPRPHAPLVPRRPRTDPPQLPQPHPHPPRRKRHGLSPPTSPPPPRRRPHHPTSRNPQHRPHVPVRKAHALVRPHPPIPHLTACLVVDLGECCTPSASPAPPLKRPCAPGPHDVARSSPRSCKKSGMTPAASAHPGLSVIPSRPRLLVHAVCWHLPFGRFRSGGAGDGRSQG
ncbi:alpha/beta fold hydrolase [Kribbella sp. NPDC026596]|uniref:alpha/beta fold hydrolase n=1 Tax=Kribbella sp. NPDC026596 TaxID=3155122 RepID=UPI0033D94EBE